VGVLKSSNDACGGVFQQGCNDLEVVAVHTVIANYGWFGHEFTSYRKSSNSENNTEFNTKSTPKAASLNTATFKLPVNKKKQSQCKATNKQTIPAIKKVLSSFSNKSDIRVPLLRITAIF
jgi:hypothetical protein